MSLSATQPPWVIPDVRAQIRDAHVRAGRRFVVLDDDPTGSQCVHDVDLVLDSGESLAAALAEPGSTAFVLTNTRGMTEAEAIGVTATAARDCRDLADRLTADIVLVSRGDSTLRGHLVAELTTLATARLTSTGRAADAVVIAPAYFEAGRFTVDDVHYAVVHGRPMPVGETEFSNDATFGYRSSDLREFLQEKTGGAVRAADVRSVSLTDIRTGGPARVREVLGSVSDGRYVVINALNYDDYDVVSLAMSELAARGSTFDIRCAPSFVASLTGSSARGILETEEIHRGAGPAGHGLVVVGSHVGLTSRQVDVALRGGGLVPVEFDVSAVLDGGSVGAVESACSAQITAALADSDVLLYTSRTLRRTSDPQESLALSRRISTSVSSVVRAVLPARPAWVVAKGGITSHDVAVHGLGMTRGRVIGQLLPGMISVVRPVQAEPEAVGMPYIVFAGNVGDDDTLARVVDQMRPRR